MPSPSSIVIAAIAALAVFSASVWWFRVYRRRQLEMVVGVSALASMKWRDCLTLILKALEQEGFQEDAALRQASDGGSEYVLRKAESSYLVSYKHGTAYRLGEANVRELASAMSLQGLDRGILVTLGESENFVRDVAERCAIELLDGRSLWPRVRQFVPADMLARINEQAQAQARQGIQWGAVLGVLVGVATLIVGSRFDSAPPLDQPVTVITPTESPAPSSSISNQVDAAAQQAHTAASALKEAEALSDNERAARRVRAAGDIAKITQVGSALWSTQSTLNVTLRQSINGDQPLIDEACRILVQFEELRYTRLQLEPPTGSTQPVRWRQCQ